MVILIRCTAAAVVIEVVVAATAAAKATSLSGNERCLCEYVDKYCDLFLVFLLCMHTLLYVCVCGTEQMSLSRIHNADDERMLVMMMMMMTCRPSDAKDFWYTHTHTVVVWWTGHDAECPLLFVHLLISSFSSTVHSFRVLRPRTLARALSPSLSLSLVCSPPPPPPFTIRCPSFCAFCSRLSTVVVRVYCYYYQRHVFYVLVLLVLVLRLMNALVVSMTCDCVPVCCCCCY